MATSIEQILETFHSRKLLLYPSLNQSSASIAPHPGSHNLLEPLAREGSLDAKIVMVLSVLLCALICSLGLNSIIRCVMRCSSNEDSRNGNNSTAGKTANTGIKKQALKTFPVVNYSTDPNIPGLESECVICLTDFCIGQKVRILPSCNHGFHVTCIDKWLSTHSSCPSCRHCLLETCHKVVGCTMAPQPSSNTSLPGPPHDIVIIISPLEPEGMLRDCRS